MPLVDRTACWVQVASDARTAHERYGAACRVSPGPLTAFWASRITTIAVVSSLSAVRRAARAEATLPVVESVPTEPDPRTGTQDIVMLAVTGRRERTPAELGALLHRSGLVLQRVMPSAAPLRIAEARAVAAAGAEDRRARSAVRLPSTDAATETGIRDDKRHTPRRAA